jgi:hypothetical protein
MTYIQPADAPVQRALFGVVAVVCALFFAATAVAMLLYPGGSVANPGADRYAFFENFFSDLGQTHVGYGDAGTSNLAAMMLFAFSLIAVALGLALFFVIFSRLFRRSGNAILLSRIAALCGFVTCVSFIGVALTPWNLFLNEHNLFVTWAFRSFLAAVLLLTIATMLEPGFPRSFASVFGVFALVLGAYVGLLAFGPPASTPAGSVVQVTGQKVIAYASVLVVLIQALSARALLRR